METPAPHPPATADLAALVYDELRVIAHGYFRRQPASFTLRPTEIVNEACLHLLQHGRVNWQSPAHFRAIATRKIWQVIIDHLKSRHAAKRGGTAGAAATAPGDPAASRRRVPLSGVTIEWHDRAVDLLDLADALEELARERRRVRETVMLHWFGGFTYAQIAPLLSVSASTVEKDFRYGMAWLCRRLAGDGPDAH